MNGVWEWEALFDTRNGFRGCLFLFFATFFLAFWGGSSYSSPRENVDIGEGKGRVLDIGYWMWG